MKRLSESRWLVKTGSAACESLLEQKCRMPVLVSIFGSHPLSNEEESMYAFNLGGNAGKLSSLLGLGVFLFF